MRTTSRSISAGSHGCGRSIQIAGCDAGLFDDPTSSARFLTFGRA